MTTSSGFPRWLLVAMLAALMFISTSDLSTAHAKTSWGMDLPGIFKGIKTDEKIVALTFDACGKKCYGAEKNDYDGNLIEFLRKERISATLFINERWIKAHPEIFASLASDPLFEIGNHGTRHVPLSIDGRSAYGIIGTSNRSDVISEVETCADTIEKLTGKRPRFFRAGTAHYDDESVAIVQNLGYLVAGFSVNGDWGATLPAEKVKKNVLSAGPGAIVLCHMNHPESGTAVGIQAAVEELTKRGYRFVTLSELYDMQR